MTKEELAKWLHDNYETVAKEKDWNTQQSCKVEFENLPDANKRTMIEIADRLLNFNLLRLHFVVGQSEQLKAEDKDLPFAVLGDSTFNVYTITYQTETNN